MRSYHYRYPVKLSEQQRQWLEAMMHISTPKALLGRPSLVDERIRARMNQRQPMDRLPKRSPSVAAR